MDIEDIDQDELKKVAEAIAKEHVGKYIKDMNPDPKYGAMMDSLEKKPGGNIPAQRKNTNGALPSKYSRQDVRNLLIRSETVKCQECGHYTFENVFLIKRISPIMSPTGEEQVLPVQVFQCTQCKGVNDTFLPEAAIADIREEQKAAAASKKDRMSKKEKQRRKKREKSVTNELEIDKHM
jgi:hypothetical protein